MSAPAAFNARIAAIPRPYDAAAAERLMETIGAGGKALSKNAQGLARAVGGASPYLARLIARAPDDFAALMKRTPEESLALVLAATHAVGDLADKEAVMRALRRAKGDAALLAGLAEVGGVWTSLEAGAALSDFADAAAGAALRAALNGLGPKGFLNAGAPSCEKNSGVAVIAMGKLGGRELNYSSDIDLIVLFDAGASAFADAGAAREIAVAAARLLVRLLNEQTADGYVFRTDLRLRPDPGVSAAAVSARAAEAYYEAHGQNWERAAFIKARAAAGDIAVGEAFLQSLRPFVWRKYLDFAAIEDIHSIKRQIHAAKGGETIEFLGHDIKTGRGGIREIEFLAQTQQLILGGKDAGLRQRATVDALAALHRSGQIKAEAFAELTAAYRYLRRVEHRLQMINDEQTHKIPRDEAGALRLAAFLGEASAGAFEEKLLETLRATHRRFSELFEREERLSTGAGSLIFTGVENDRATLATLERLGFRRAADVSATIRRWHTGTLRATRSARARELLTKLAPRLLEALAKSSDPDAAFVAFDQFLSRLPAGVQVFALFANNPQVFDVLIRIMTISPFLGRELSRRGHLVEALLESDWPGKEASSADLKAALDARLKALDAYEAKLNEARRWMAEHRFETAASLAIGMIGAPDAAARFTAAADAAIDGLLAVAEAETRRLHGRLDGAISVIAMGRLGAGAMTASSDVDLVFIYEAAEGAQSDGAKPLDAVTYYLRLVRRFLTALSATTEEGSLFEVDMQLRPTGSKGPWAVSLAAFERYYDKDAWTWEEMALTKARIVAGDESLGRKVRAAIDRILTRPRDPAKLAADVRDMRRRVAGAKPAGGPWDVKLAMGGLTDVDFILAYFVLKNAALIGAPPPGAREMLVFLRENDAIAARPAEGLLTALELFETIMQLSRAAVGGQFAPMQLSRAAAGEALAARMAAALGESRIEAAEEGLLARLEAVKRIYDAVIPASEIA